MSTAGDEWQASAEYAESGAVDDPEVELDPGPPPKTPPPPGTESTRRAAASPTECDRTMTDERGDVNRNDATDTIGTGLETITEGEIEELDERLIEARKAFEELKERRFDAAKAPERRDATVSINGTGIATPGNIVVLGGQSGSAKSNVGAAMLAASMATESGGDFLGFTAPNREGKAVIWLDCEQAEDDFWNLMHGAMRRAGVARRPDWLLSYCMTGKEPAEIRKALGSLLTVARADFGGVHFVFLDGFGDLVRGKNDEVAAEDLVRELHAAAAEFDTVIAGILHHNSHQESVKMRGHLGSEIERKAETVLAVKRDPQTDAVTLYTTKTRRVPIPEAKGPRFAWDSEAGMFLSIASQSEIVATHKAKERSELVKAAFLTVEGMRHAELVDRVAELEAIKPDAAKKRIATLRKEGFVTVQPATGLYHKGANFNE